MEVMVNNQVLKRLHFVNEFFREIDAIFQRKNDEGFATTVSPEKIPSKELHLRYDRIIFLLKRQIYRNIYKNTATL